MARYIEFPLIMKIVVNKFLDEKHINNKKEIIDNTYKYYKEFVKEVPDLGGSKNTMSYNLYYSLSFFAFYEAMDRNITYDEFYTFLDKNSQSLINVISKITGIFHKTIENILTKQFNRYKKLSESNDWNNTWKIELNPHHRENGLAFDFTTCPIAEFAIKHDYKDIMPILCNMDFLTAKLMGSKLIRENTIIKDNKPCDYWYVKDNK